MKALSLFPYQDKSIDSLRNGFRQRHKKQIFYLPTGGGKTESAIYLLQKCQEKGTRAAMVMDRRVLVYQTSERLKKYGLEHGIIMNGEPHQTDKLIQICSEQTLASRGGLGEIGLIILDEAHIFRKSTLELLETNPNVNVVGLTATPFTKGLADIYSNVVSEITTHELVEMGRLINPKYFMLTPIDTKGVKKIGGEYSERELQERALLINGDIVKEWIKHTFQYFGKPEKTIVFSCGVDHSSQLENEFKLNGFNFKSISYLDNEDTKNAIIEEFNKPDSEIIGLISTDILTKGFDCPDVKIGVSARPFAKSFSSHVQQLGRVMRSAPNKDLALWLCHSGNLENFKPEWKYLYYFGVDDLENKEDGKKKKPPLKKCPSCESEIPLGCKTCPECGHQFESKQREIETVKGELKEVDILSSNAVFITSWEFSNHISKAGNIGMKAVINNKYTKYFATHTIKGNAEYQRCLNQLPLQLEVIKKRGEKFPELKLIW